MGFLGLKGLGLSVRFLLLSHFSRGRRWYWVSIHIQLEAEVRLPLGSADVPQPAPVSLPPAQLSPNCYLSKELTRSRAELGLSITPERRYRVVGGIVGGVVIRSFVKFGFLKVTDTTQR